MADVLVTIKSLYGSLSPVQKRLADHVLRNGDAVPFLSVHRLARAAGVSVASISRFARAVGFRNVRDFKVRLGKDARSSFRGMYEAIGPEDREDEIIEKVVSGNVRSLEDTLKIVNRRDLVRAARVIAGAKRVVFFGIGSSGHIAQDAALRFSQLDVEAAAFFDSYRMLGESLRMKKGEVAFGISHSGRSAITVRVLALASRNGALTIGMSNYLRSPLHNVSKIFLCTSFPEAKVKVAALSSRVAQMCLIDVLYLLAARYRETPLGGVERLNAYTERLLRLALQ